MMFNMYKLSTYYYIFILFIIYIKIVQIFSIKASIGVPETGLNMMVGIAWLFNLRDNPCIFVDVV